MTDDDDFQYAIYEEPPFCAYENLEASISPLWRLHDHFAIVQAAGLLAGYEPNDLRRFREDDRFDDRFPRLYAPLSALINAVSAHTLAAQVAKVNYREWDFISDCWAEIETDDIDIYKTTIAYSDLMTWLKDRGFKSGFFFPDADDGPEYMDPQNARYAPKLAAAIKAWQAVTDPGKSSPKKALEKWLREHAAQFGLTDDEGCPINQAIEECSKVANWRPSGGAPSSSGPSD